jgi:hypothetical protein
MNNKQRLIEHLRYRIIEKLNEDNENNQKKPGDMFYLVSNNQPDPSAEWHPDVLSHQADVIARQLDVLHDQGHIEAIHISTDGENEEIIPGKDITKDYLIHSDFIRELLQRNNVGHSGSGLHSVAYRITAGLVPAEHPRYFSYPGDRNTLSDMDIQDKKYAIESEGLSSFHPDFTKLSTFRTFDRNLNNPK